MTYQTKTPDVTVEEIPTQLIDHQPYQVVAYPTREGVVVVVREWPTVDADK